MALPAWWDRKGQRQNARSRAQERRTARETGGRPTPGSGSSYRAPGDVKDPTTLWECKYTDRKSFQLTRDMVRQHWARAARVGREPAILIEFTGTPPLRVVVVPYEP